MNKIVIDTDKYDLIVDNDNYSIEVINTKILNIKVLENVYSKMTILIQNTNIFINISCLFTNKNSSKSLVKTPLFFDS